MLLPLALTGLVLGTVAVAEQDGVFGETDPVVGRKCAAGETGVPQVLWYFDFPRNTVYPFRYLGCGETNGKSYDDARRSGRMDHQVCPGYYKPSVYCSGDKLHPLADIFPIRPQKCKSGDYCMVPIESTGGGYCCNKEIRERYNKSFAVKCPSGYSAVFNDYIQDFKIVLFVRLVNQQFRRLGCCYCVGSSLILGVYSHALVVTDSGMTDPIVGRHCKAGEKGQTEIRWYYDFVHNTHYPFKYLGCGDTNGNSYETAIQVQMRYRTVCPGYSEPSGLCYTSHDEDECGLDYCFANNGTSAGFCCDRAVRERFDENRKAECPNGFSAVKNTQENRMLPLFGKNCTHEFCPNNSRCIDGEFQAYCCSRMN